MSQPIPSIPDATEDALQQRRVHFTGREPAVDLAELAPRLATAIRLRDEAEAGYRQFRAEFGARLRAEDPKLAEWKAKEACDASPEFQAWKKALANGEAWVAFFSALADSRRIAGGLGRTA